jgi:hypothetical protein
MKKALYSLLTVLVLTISQFFFVTQAQAQSCGYTACNDGCTSPGQCSSIGKTCVVSGSELRAGTEPCGGGEGAAVFGSITMPPGIYKYSVNNGGGGNDQIGLINFLSLMLRIFTIVAGLFFMFNLIYAGYLFLSAGSDAGQFNKFKEMLYYSLIGLLVIAMAYMIAGVAGLFLFGDAGYIIQPALYQATGS